MEKIVITGGSGLLGRALIERLHNQVDLTVFSRSEKSQLKLRGKYPNVRFLLGDICDRAFLDQAFFRQNVVIHAAALKHVNISEREPTEYIKVNAVGSIHVGEAAFYNDMRCIGVSTDKACDPCNVYGHTKLLMERLFTEMGYACVRYGNVFGSDGSVLELWRRQLMVGDTITVTDPDMTRFFFRISEAVDEVLWPLHNPSFGSGIVIPRLRAATIGDLAQAFIKHVGRGKVKVIGHREGEKQHECLLSEHECQYARACDDRIILTPNERQSQPVLEPLTSDVADRIGEEELVEWLQAGL